MGALTVNGVDLPVVEATHSTKLIGDVGTRAFSGKILDSVRAYKEEWKFKSQPGFMQQNDAIAWRGLILGLGHSFSFDTTLYSDGKGLGPSSSTGCSVAATSPSPKYGAGRLTITTGNHGTWPVGINTITGAYTLLFWFWNGASWDHYIYTQTLNGGTTATYKNGSAGSLPAGAVTGISGGLQLNGAGGASNFFDDVVILPFFISATMAAGLYTYSNTQAWQPLPQLTITGDLIQGATRIMQGYLDDGAAGYQFQVPGGSWVDNGEVISFTLSEV